MIAALFVESEGVYYGLPDIDPWPLERDARTYLGPHPVIAHPPCERWGRFWHGLARHGYEKARRIGIMAMVGGKNKTRVRNATPVEFRDVLIEMVSLTNTEIPVGAFSASSRAPAAGCRLEPRPCRRELVAVYFHPEGQTHAFMRRRIVT